MQSCLFGISELDMLWRAGRIEELGRILQVMMTASGDSDLAKLINTKLLVERNQAWASWIDQRMNQPGHVFFAVGAAHLAGTDNLREILESKGYSIHRMNSETASSD